MKKHRPDNFSLVDAVRSNAFTPSVRDVGYLVDLMATADEKSIERALVRLGPPAAPELLARLPGSTRPVRGILVKILGRIAQPAQDPRITETLLSLLYDEDLKTRRNAIIALGRLPLPGIENALLSKWKSEDRIDHRRSLAASLGRIGGEKSMSALREFKSDDAELTRIIQQATLMISRNLSRAEESAIAAGTPPTVPVGVVAYCRAGLEEILASEFGADCKPRVLGAGRVGLTLRGPLETVFQARTLLAFGIALAPVHGDSPAAVARAVTSPEAIRIFKTWTRGRIRYRLEWADGGHRRADVWKCAKEISNIRPELVNDPSDSTWEVVIHAVTGGAEIVLRPKKLPDPRFGYRLRSVYASSHPTLSAALVRIAGVRRGDVVWDPFVGSGVELAERAIAGPYRELHGTDSDSKAIEIARQNLAAAGVTDAHLAVADAATSVIPRVSLIITNPPMGRRVGVGDAASAGGSGSAAPRPQVPAAPTPADIGRIRRAGVEALLGRFIRHAARTLISDGRFVWISPFPDRHVEEARQAGLKLKFKRDVDMGGFRGQIQRYEKN